MFLLSSSKPVIQNPVSEFERMESNLSLAMLERSSNQVLKFGNY